MKNKNRKQRKETETFPLRCGRENGEYLELRIPQVLYRSFECTFSTDEGRGYLVNLFTRFGELDKAGQDTYQMILLEGVAKNQIRCISELLPLLEAVIEAIKKGNLTREDDEIYSRRLLLFSHT